MQSLPNILSHFRIEFNFYQNMGANVFLSLKIDFVWTNSSDLAKMLYLAAFHLEYNGCNSSHFELDKIVNVSIHGIL